MDFHTLSRKELQALCKKNKIPANMTNVAMANALADLQQVEGLDEVLNTVDFDAQKFPDEKVVGTPDIHRTACRTSTRRKPAAREGTDQENKNLNVPVTPAVPSSRTRAPAVTTRRKKEDEKLTETPAASRSRLRATSAYNTRRSVRLLEKNLSKMSLMDTEETDDISKEMTSVSQQIEDSADTEKGASSQTISTKDLEKTNEVEVTSSKKSTGYECQSNDSKSEVQLDLEVANDAGASSHTVSAEDLEKINQIEVTSSEKNTGYECQFNDSKSEVQLDSEPEVENDAGDSFQAVPQDCPGEINESEAPSKDISSCYEGEPPVPECCDESEVDFTKDNEVDTNHEAVTAISCDSSEPDHKISPCAKNDVSSVEDDASMEATGDKQKEDEHSTTGNDDQNSELMNKAVETDVPQRAVEDDASVEVAEDKHEENEYSNVANYIQNSELIGAENEALNMDDLVEVYFSEGSTGEQQEIYVTEGAAEDDASVVVEDKHEENEDSNMANYIQNSELIGAENEALIMDDLVEVYVSEGSTGEQHEILEDIAYPSMVVCEELEADKTSTDLEESKEFVEKDASSENSVADTQACIEPLSETNTNFQSDKDIEEYKEQAAAEEETLHATSAFHSADQPHLICNEQQTSDADAVEVQTIRKMTTNQEDNEQKENLNNVDLHKMSMRELKKMLRNLSLDGKTNTKSSNSVNKEVERKRTALQVLPENRMTASNGGHSQNDS